MKQLMMVRRMFSMSVSRHMEASILPRCELDPNRCLMVPCCVQTQSHYSSAPCPMPEVEDKLWSKVMQYSKYRPIPLSIESFVHHGENDSKEASFRFLKHEIPTRLAGVLLEFNLLPNILQRQEQFQQVRKDHLQSFKEIVNLADDSEDVLESFDEILLSMRARHADTVSELAEAVMETKFELEDKGESVDTGVENAITYFLDRVYMTRISNRMLLNQHLYVHGDNIAKPRHVGQIDPYCDVVTSVKRAFAEAARLCGSHYGEYPDLRVISNNKTSSEAGDVPILFPYVPSHLHHMIFEVLKNSMRATVEHSRKEGLAALSPIRVLISKTDVDITIKISDQGGGIPRSQIENLFRYMYTTAGRVGKAHAALVRNSQLPPMAGLGYGLPLSRLYARYFQGDLDISSIHGVGTDCFIYLRSSEANAPEQIPIYSLSTSKTYRDKSLEKADDWTDGTDIEDRDKDEDD